MSDIKTITPFHLMSGEELDSFMEEVLRANHWCGTGVTPEMEMFREEMIAKEKKKMARFLGLRMVKGKIV
jgi:hypothetical protein